MGKLRAVTAPRPRLQRAGILIPNNQCSQQSLGCGGACTDPAFPIARCVQSRANV